MVTVCLIPGHLDSDLRLQSTEKKEVIHTVAVKIAEEIIIKTYTLGFSVKNLGKAGSYLIFNSRENDVYMLIRILGIKGTNFAILIFFCNLGSTYLKFTARKKRLGGKYDFLNNATKLFLLNLKKKLIVN